MEQTLFIPWPPSTNSIWRSVNGTNILSQKYRKWIKAASLELMIQRPKKVAGRVSLSIRLKSPTKHKFDLDNRAKAAIDLLVRNLIIEGDDSSILRDLHISLSHSDTPGAYITIRPWIG